MPSNTDQFVMQSQCHLNWCWAAVSSSISHFYDSNSQNSQCVIANIELARSDCCDFPCNQGGLEFDVPRTLASPLGWVGCLRSWDPNGSASRSTLQKELNAGRPVCARIKWLGGGAHFVVIVQFDAESDKVIVKDSSWDRREISYDQLRTNYGDDQGKWTDTFYTKSPTAQA